MFYILNSQGECLTDFDYSKHPSTPITDGTCNGCYWTPDAWSESTDPNDEVDPAFLFVTKVEAQAIIDLMEQDPYNQDKYALKYSILSVKTEISRTINLTEEQLTSLVSTLKWALDSGSGGPYFDYHAVQKVIRQLE